MSFWDEFKKLFQTDQQREEEKSSKITDALKNESSVVEQLQKLEEEYQAKQQNTEETDIESLFPTSLGLSKVEYTPKTDAELKAQAEAELLSDVESKKNGLLKTIANQKDSTEASKEASVQDAEDSLAKLDELYKSLKSKAENNALKRGMARSSVIMNQLLDYDTQQGKATTSVQNTLLNQIASANQKLNDLEAEKETALNELNLDYASKIAKRMSTLENERDENVLKYQKYNDDVAQKEANYSATRAKNVQNYLKTAEENRAAEEEKVRADEAENGYSGEKLENYAKRYDIAYSFYNSLAPDIAADALAASPNMRFYLGNYYDKLMSVLKSKGSATNRYY